MRPTGAKGYWNPIGSCSFLLFLLVQLYPFLGEKNLMPLK